ncbi:HlyD family secretion protein, partial [Mesorhizobium sp. M4B.F.Ca.ET.019.03.1.1]
MNAVAKVDEKVTRLEREAPAQPVAEAPAQPAVAPAELAPSPQPAPKKQRRAGRFL